MVQAYERGASGCVAQAEEKKGKTLRMACDKTPCYLLPCASDGKPSGKYCVPCERVEPAGGIETVEADRRNTPQRPRGLTVSARTSRRDRIPTETEAGLVRSIVEALTLSGYVVLKTNQWRGDMSGSTPGCPDLFVRHPRAGRGQFVAMEVKTQTGRLSAAQSALYEAGHIYVVKSPDEAIKIMRERGE
jgi:hypothetical protein